LQADEDALSMALVALVLGTRLTVTWAAVLHYLQEFYGIVEGAVSICRTPIG
jgi:putative intracellular protease/amidase